MVVVQAGFGVGVLAGEAERGVGAARFPQGGTPEGVLLVAGQVPVRADKFAGGADQVGDDRVEPLIDIVLGGFAETSASTSLA